MEKVWNFVKDNKAFIISMTLYTLITFLRVIFHQPWFDEAHAWIIADQLNIVEIFKLMQIEGHTFIWYVLLMPFAKNDLWYPYPMLILNWIFCWSAVFIMWRKAPFNNLIKILITFSYPFIALYSVIARCYALGIMFVFAIASLYKKQLERPYLYASLIILCANTSVMAMAGAGAFGFIFLYKIFKACVQKTDNITRKNLIISMLILGLGVLLVYLQIGHADSSNITGNYNLKMGFDLTYFAKTFIFPPIVNLTLIAAGLFIFPVMLYKKKDSLFFIIFTYGFLLSVFYFIYKGSVWHTHFFSVYLITALWILLEQEKENFFFRKAGLIFFSLILAFYVADFRYTTTYFQSGSKYISQIIINDKELRNSRLIFNGVFERRLLPYLKNSGVEAYDYCRGEKADYHYHKINEFCPAEMTNTLSVYGIQRVMSDDRQNFLLQTMNPYNESLGMSNGFIIEDSKMSAKFTPYKKFGKNLIFFKVEVYKTRRPLSN